MTQTIVTRAKTRPGRTRRPAALSRRGMAIGKYVDDAASLGARTFQGLNALRKLINVETKVINVNSTSTAVGTSGVITCLSQVAQGSDYTSRVGDSIRLQTLELRMRVFQNLTATQTVFRVVVFRDLDGYGVAPAITDLFDATGGAGNTISQYNWLNNQRFSILFDELQTFSSTNESTAAVAFKTDHQGHVKYLGTTAATASNGKGSVYLLVVSDEGVNTPTYAYNSRVTFTDN